MADYPSTLSKSLDILLKMGSENPDRIEFEEPKRKEPVRIIVVRNRHAQETWWKTFGKSPTDRVITPGAMIAGFRADLILLTFDYWFEASNRDVAARWLQQLESRLLPGGRMLTL